MSNPTKAESEFHDIVAGLGCIACMLDGIINPVVSIHHIDGRTKKGAHMKVLPLCAGHHQNGTGNDISLIAMHPYKARFESRYGTQAQLLELVNELLVCEDAGAALSDYIVRHKLFDDD